MSVVGIRLALVLFERFVQDFLQTRPMSAGYAPGRIELLGNHTDYNQGLVLGLAIDLGLTVAGCALDGKCIRLRSENQESEITVSLDQLKSAEVDSWANYAIGVVEEFRQLGYEIGGFEATVSGNLPSGVGLSSSAAFEVATAGFLMQLGGWHLDPIHVAKICQRAENNFVGIKSGLLDQVTSIFGRTGHAILLDCKTEEIRVVPIAGQLQARVCLLLERDLVFVVAEAGEKRKLLHSSYNQRRAECAEAGNLLGVNSLREVSSENLAAARNRLDPLLWRRARHIVGENERVAQAIEKLLGGDIAGVGKLLNESHESSQTNFENSTVELDRIVHFAQSLPGVYGARLTGGGFGGAAVILAHLAHAERIVEALRARSVRAESYHAGDGAAVFWETDRSKFS